MKNRKSEKIIESAKVEFDFDNFEVVTYPNERNNGFFFIRVKDEPYITVGKSANRESARYICAALGLYEKQYGKINRNELMN